MKLARFGDRGLERPAVLGEEGRRLDVSEFVWDFDEQFFATNPSTNGVCTRAGQMQLQRMPRFT